MVTSPGRRPLARNSHCCHPCAGGAPTSRAFCHGPPATLTSTRSMGAAPDQATPRTITAPPGSSWPVARPGDQGADVHQADRLARVAPAVAAFVDVVRGLEEAVERLRDHPDVGEPLDRGDRVPAGHDQPERVAVPDRERLAVHRVGEQRARLQGVAYREAALETDRVRRAVDRALVGAAEDHLAGTGPDPGAGENVGQARPGPLGGAHGPGTPLHTGRRRLEQRPPVPGAFQRDRHGFRGQPGQLGQAQAQRPIHHAADAEPPRRRVEHRDRKVAAPVELGGRRHLPAQPGRRGLAVQRLRLVHDEPGLGGIGALSLQVGRLTPAPFPERTGTRFPMVMACPPSSVCQKPYILSYL